MLTQAMGEHCNNKSASQRQGRARTSSIVIHDGESDQRLDRYGHEGAPGLDILHGAWQVTSQRNRAGAKKTCTNSE